MKSFFKKLSLVLVAAMVITMLPAQSAKAATKVALGPVGQKEAAEANTAQTYELKVGETVDWTFYGVVDYNAAGRKTKLWTSSNPAVATVANGKITAVAVGKTKITLTVTNNGIDYIGQADLTVLAKDAAPVAGAPVVKQVAYNKIEIAFADADAAKAAKDAVVSVTRVRTGKNGQELNLFSGANVDQKPAPENNVLVVSNLSNEVTYKIVIPGYKTPYVVTMSVGEPVAVKLTYPTVYISASDKVSSDISGNPIKYPEVTPIAEVVDANGIVCESVQTGFKFSTDKTKNTGNVSFTTGNGRIRFNKAESSCYVKCEYSYKNAEGKVVPCDYDEVTVSPVPYTAPNFQGFVEKITLTEEVGTEIEYPSDYNYTASIAIGGTKYLAYYFETVDGTKYTPESVYTTVHASGLKENKSMNKIKADGSAYSYYVVKDDKTKNKISIKDLDGKIEIKGFEEGTQTICVYERRLGTDGDDVTKDKLVGVLTITVEPKAEIVDLHLSENSVNGYKNTLIAADQKIYVEFKLEDQYGNNTAGDIKLRDENGNTVTGVSFLKSDKSASGATNLLWRGAKKGLICIDVTQFDLSEKGKTLVVSIDDQNDPCRDNIYVTTKNIDTSKGAGFALMADNVSIKNKTIRSGINDAAKDATSLALTIDVANTKGGERYDPYAEFYIIGDDDITKVSGRTGLNNKLLVWITREDGSVLKKTVNGEEFPLASELGAGQFQWATSGNAFCVLATDTGSGSGNPSFKLDLIKNATTSTNLITDETFLQGRYTIYLYRGNSSSKPTLIDNVEISISDDITRVDKLDTFYEIAASTAETAKGLPVQVKVNDEKVEAWNKANVQTAAEGLATQFDKIVMEIVSTLYVWIDVDGNGKCVNNAGDATQPEIFRVGNLFDGDFDRDHMYTDQNVVDGSGFVRYSLKYVAGAEGSKEIYISSVTIRFRMPGTDGATSDGALVEKTLNINTKYEYNN